MLGGATASGRNPSFSGDTGGGSSIGRRVSSRPHPPSSGIHSLVALGIHRPVLWRYNLWKGSVVQWRFWWWQQHWTPRAIRAAADRLLPLVQGKVKRVFEHIFSGCLDSGTWCYVPKQATDKTEYRRLYDLRKLVVDDASQLRPDDYELLAYLPHILGPQVFGETVSHESGWRWTFARASINAHSETFSTEEAAMRDLAIIQKQLHSCWPN